MNKEIFWVSDFFAEELNGGAELNDAAAIEVLENNGFEVRKARSENINANFIENGRIYIFSNFARIKDKETFMAIADKLIERGIQYYIFENDHKYCIHRNAFLHGPSLKCNCYPKDTFVHLFYFFAQAVFTQTHFHDQIFDLNTYCNHVCLGTNLWRKEELKLLDELKQSASSNGKYLIFNSQHYHKNTKGAIEYATKNGLQYELIAGMKWPDLMKKLSESEGIIFIPRLTESASRWIFEAKYLGKKVITNKLVGYAREDWWGKDNIEFELIFNNAEHVLINELNHDPPKISIFCTTFNSEKHIKGYLENVVSFISGPKYEVVVYDGGSTDKTVEIIRDFNKHLRPAPGAGSLVEPLRKIRLYQNKITTKDGIYKGWNRALSKCRGNIVINMNVDDRFSEETLAKLYIKLNENNNDFVYADSYITKIPNETFEQHTNTGELNWPTYDKKLLRKMCFGGHMPMWAKKWINKIGLFNESFQSAGDWDFWIRLSEAGAKFEHLSEKLGLYYFNPDGKSTTETGASSINQQESAKIVTKYNK
jgi:GT2 family glycosyltransferase